MAEWPPEMATAFEKHAANPVRQQVALPRDGAGDLVEILARNPALFAAWSDFSTALQVARRLPPREKELAILRVAWRCQAPYEWGQHVRRGLAAGVTRSEIDRVKRGPDDGGWDELDRALVRAADELHDDGTISDESWTVLAARYDHPQLIELTMLIGFYHLMAYVLNAFQVPLEDGIEGLDGLPTTAVR
jgi:alkylhydroperoxidase family enzyme